MLPVTKRNISNLNWHPFKSEMPKLFTYCHKVVSTLILIFNKF